MSLLFSNVVERSLVRSSVVTISLLATSLTGLLIEHDRKCEPDLRLWLIVVVVGSIIRFPLWTILEFDEYTIQNLNRSLILVGVPSIEKLINAIDMLGFVWFLLGNFLIFDISPKKCFEISPVVYLSSISYIAGSYIMFVMPQLIRLTLKMFHLPEEHLTEVVPRIPSDIEQALSTEQTDQWRAWLSSYGCLPQDGLQSGFSDGKGDSLEVEDEEFCSICLLQIKQDIRCCESSIDKVASGSDTKEHETCYMKDDGSSPNRNVATVCFPCYSRHKFHERCLHNWLHTLESREILSTRNMTFSCPNCREGPVSIEATRSMDVEYRRMP